MAKIDLDKEIEAIQLLMLKNEYRTSKYKGVSNLTRADLEEIILYINAYQHDQLYQLVRPSGEMLEVLIKLGIYDKA